MHLPIAVWHDHLLNVTHCASCSSTREECLVGEVFEMLLSLSDFDTFKELMLSYKQVRHGVAWHWQSVCAWEGAYWYPNPGPLVGHQQLIGHPYACHTQEKMNGSLLDINIRPMMLHIGDEEDGDHRPDLDDHLIVSPAGSGK